ncbi:MAG TPA: ASCH domain-containing protein [Deinococcales bacterium]|nr:ASCH domain-containing protein [Deinococcales bacterium]
MIFQHTHAAVLNGSKTQTRRRRKPGERPHDGYRPGLPILKVIDSSGRSRYEVGKTYAVQEHRGGRAVARIQITGIRYFAAAGIITAEDAAAEGFESIRAFLTTYGVINGAAALWLPCWSLSFQLVEGSQA